MAAEVDVDVSEIDGVVAAIDAAKSTIIIITTQYRLQCHCVSRGRETGLAEMVWKVEEGENDKKDQYIWTAEVKCIWR